MGLWGFFFYCIIFVLYVFFVENLVECYGIWWMYVVGMMIFILLMGGMVLFWNIYFVNIMVVLIGFGYVIFMIIFFIIVMKYYLEKEVSVKVNV